MSKRQEVTSLLRTVDALDAEVDDTERNILSPLRRLAERLPTCTEELEASEVNHKFPVTLSRGSRRVIPFSLLIRFLSLGEFHARDDTRRSTRMHLWTFGYLEAQQSCRFHPPG